MCLLVFFFFKEVHNKIKGDDKCLVVISQLNRRNNTLMSLLNIYSQSKRFTCTLCDCIVTCADQSLSITLTYAKRKKKSVFHKAKLWFHMVNSLFSHALIYFFSAPPNCCLGLRLRHFLEKRLSFYLILHKKLFNWHNLQNCATCIDIFFIFYL